MSAKVLATVTTRLAPLANVLRMSHLSGSDADRMPRNVLQLQLDLLRLVATPTPAYWMQVQLPAESECAACYADTTTIAAAASLLHADDSPTERATLAMQCGALRTRDGGLGLPCHRDTRHAQFAGTFHAVWPGVLLANPTLSDLRSTTHQAFADAYKSITALLSSVRARHLALAKDVRHWVDGSEHHAFYPPLSSQFRLPSFADLFVDANANIAVRFSQRKAMAVCNADAWLRAKDAVDAFDSANQHAASVRQREARRLVSCSQEGSGAFLMRHPDPYLIGSVAESDYMLVRVQRRLGLYLTCLAVPLDAAEARGEIVTQHMRLGDDAINDANATHRHNAGLLAVHAAITAVTDSRRPYARTLRGDKGDGSPAGAADAKRRWAWANDGHIPDIVRCSAPPYIWEWKCCSPLITSAALGNGSSKCGGAPSTVDGDRFAFGCTEEAMRRKVYGLRQRGKPGERAFDRRSGQGHVAPHDGDYADALRKGHGLLLLMSESTGALGAGLVMLLRTLARTATLPSGSDTTVYGASRASPKAFFPHHLASISSAIVDADAQAVLAKAAHETFMLSLGAPPLPPGPPPPPPPPTSPLAPS